MAFSSSRIDSIFRFFVSLRGLFFGASSTVNLTQHDVQTAHDGHNVRDHRAPANLLERAHGGETGRLYFHSIGLQAAVAYDVIPQFTPRTLRAHIHLSGRRLDALGNRFVHVAGGDLCNSLASDLAALFDFLDPDHVPVVARTYWSVFSFPDGDIEIELVVVEIGLILADIPLHAASAQIRACDPMAYRR